MRDLLHTLSTENVVGSTSIDQELDLESLADDLDGVKYDPNQFPGVVSRTTEPKAASLIFRSGKIVCIGASSVEDLMTAAELTFEKLRALGLEVPPEPDLTVQNIVTSGDLGTRRNRNWPRIGGHRVRA